MVNNPKESASFRHEREWPILLKVAREYKLTPQETIFLLSIREVEKGGKGFEMGVKAAKGTDLETQAKWAAGSIKENTERYNKLMTTGFYKGNRRTIMIEQPADKIMDFKATSIKPDTDYIDFFHRYASPTGYGWAPIDLPEMKEKEKKLNKNWGNNMHSEVKKLTKHFMEKGVDYGANNQEPRRVEGKD